MSTGCSKCEASAGHRVIRYQTGGSKCEIRGCSKCENRLRHEYCFIVSKLCSKCVSVTIYWIYNILYYMKLTYILNNISYVKHYIHVEIVYIIYYLWSIKWVFPLQYILYIILHSTYYIKYIISLNKYMYILCVYIYQSVNRIQYIIC